MKLTLQDFLFDALPHFFLKKGALKTTLRLLPCLMVTTQWRSKFIDLDPILEFHFPTDQYEIAFSSSNKKQHKSMYNMKEDRHRASRACLASSTLPMVLCTCLDNVLIVIWTLVDGCVTIGKTQLNLN